MKVYLFAMVLLFSAQGSGQTVNLINLDQLYNRVSNSNDTTYVINFWATWCIPCLEELPSFEKLSVSYKKEKLKVLLVSLDFKSALKTSVIPYVKKKNIREAVFLLDEADQQAYINRIDADWSGALPATLIIKNKRRRFFEKEFSYTELLSEYKKIQLL